jgi:hypothetical protein
MVYNLDVMIFQHGMDDPSFVGVSMAAAAGSSAGAAIVLPVALLNDHHWWGLDRLAATEQPSDVPQRDYGEWVCVHPGKRKIEESAPAGNDECDDDMDFKEEDCCSDRMQAEEVEAELALVKALLQWSPWDQPSESLVRALQGLAAVSTKASSGARIRLRAKCVEDLMYEEAPRWVGIETSQTSLGPSRNAFARTSGWPAGGGTAGRLGQREEGWGGRGNMQE